MSFIDFFGTARDLMQKGHDADLARNYVKAKDLYTQSVSYLLSAIKCTCAKDNPSYTKQSKKMNQRNGL